MGHALKSFSFLYLSVWFEISNHACKFTFPNTRQGSSGHWGWRFYFLLYLQSLIFFFFFLLNNLITSRSHKGFPGGSVVKDSPANAGDTGSIPDMGRPACHRATKPVCHNY